MIERKRKLRIIQFSLLLIALIIIFATYSNKNNDELSQSFSDINKENKDLINKEENGEINIFFNMNTQELTCQATDIFLDLKRQKKSDRN